MARSSSRRRITDDMLRTIIIKRLPRLLEKEPPLRDYLANLLSDKFADKEKAEEEL